MDALEAGQPTKTNAFPSVTLSPSPKDSTARSSSKLNITPDLSPCNSQEHPVPGRLESKAPPSKLDDLRTENLSLKKKILLINQQVQMKLASDPGDGINGKSVTAPTDCASSSPTHPVVNNPTQSGSSSTKPSTKPDNTSGEMTGTVSPSTLSSSDCQLVERTDDQEPLESSALPVSLPSTERSPVPNVLPTSLLSSKPSLLSNDVTHEYVSEDYTTLPDTLAYEDIIGEYDLEWWKHGSDASSTINK